MHTHTLTAAARHVVTGQAVASQQRSVSTVFILHEGGVVRLKAGAPAGDRAAQHD